MTEQELITYCQQESPAHQRELVRRYSSVLYGICLRYCRSADDAQDCLQESWILIFKNIHRFTSKGSFEGWIKRITINCALQQYRKKQLIDRTEGVVRETQTDTAPEIYSELSVQEIMKALRQLSDIKRIVFTMYVVEGYSHQEISEFLDIAESSSRSILTRARKELKKNIHHYDKALEL